MAGIFGFFDYTKPGKGVERGEPQKKGIARFAQLYFRKFWKYMQLNILYAITCVPALLVYWFFFVSYFAPAFQTVLESQQVTADQVYLSVNILAMASAIIMVMIFGGSPCAAGFHYVLRNYVREEHAWLWSDFWRHTGRNWKQAFAMFFIDLVVVNLLLFGIRFYYQMSGTGGAMHFLHLFLLVLIIFIFVVYAVMHQYIWTMMVTFELKLKQIVKNAFLLTVMAFPRNILFIIVTALFAVVVYLMYFYLSPLLGALITLLLFFSIYGLTMQMFSYPVIRKFMLDPLEEKEKDDEDEIEEEENTADQETQEEEVKWNRLEEPDESQLTSRNDVASLFRKPFEEEEKEIQEREKKNEQKQEKDE